MREREWFNPSLEKPQVNCVCLLMCRIKVMVDEQPSVYKVTISLTRPGTVLAGEMMTAGKRTTPADSPLTTNTHGQAACGRRHGPEQPVHVCVRVSARVCKKHKSHNNIKRCKGT